jgi:hypothetical protein
VPDAPDLVDFHRRLIDLRHRFLANDADARVHETSRPQDVVAYAQPAKNGATMACAVNFGDATDVVIDLDADARGVARDLWEGADHAIDSDRVQLHLASHAFVILELPLGN